MALRAPANVERLPQSGARRAPHLTRPHALAALLRSDGTVDWSPWYLTEEEDVGQSGEHGQIIIVLLSSLHVLAEERGWSSVLVAADNFFAWIDGEPNVQVSPDIYLLELDDPSEVEKRPQKPLPRRWEVWRAEHTAPRFAVEIVSTEWKKDYEINPARYDHLGVDELVLVDRDAFVGDLPSRGQAARIRVPFLVYRRTEEDRLEEVYRGPGPVHCAELDAWLCFHWDSPSQLRVRVSRSADGQDLVPTEGEKARAAEGKARIEAEKARAAEDQARVAEHKARAEAEKARAAKDQARAAEDQARAAKDQARAAKDQARAAENQARAAEDQARAAENQARAAKDQARTEAEKARAAEDKADAAERLARSQAAEIAALRARLQELGES